MVKIFDVTKYKSLVELDTKDHAKVIFEQLLQFIDEDTTNPLIVKFEIDASWSGEYMTHFTQQLIDKYGFEFVYYKVAIDGNYGISYTFNDHLNSIKCNYLPC